MIGKTVFQANKRVASRSVYIFSYELLLLFKTRREICNENFLRNESKWPSDFSNVIN